MITIEPFFCYSLVPEDGHKNRPLCLGLGITGIHLAARVPVDLAAAAAVKWVLTSAAVGEVAAFPCRGVFVVVVEDDAHEQADYGPAGCEQDTVVFDSGGTVREVVGYVMLDGGFGTRGVDLLY